MSEELVFAAILVVIQVTFAWNSIQRIRKTRSAEGQSLIGQSLYFGTIPGWITLAVLAGSPTFMISYTVWSIGMCGIMFYILTHHSNPHRWRVFSTAASCSLLGSFGIGLVWSRYGDFIDGLGVATNLIDLAYVLPALVAGLTSKTTLGLSPVALSMVVLSAILHLLAGAGIGFLVPHNDVVIGLLLFGVIALTHSVPILIRVCYRRLKKLDIPPLG